MTDVEFEAAEIVAAVNRLEKPAWSEPCNGCGMCCTVEPCGLGVALLGAKKGPCPAMEWDDRRFRCGLVVRPSAYLGTDRKKDMAYGTFHARMLGIGKGCDSDD